MTTHTGDLATGGEVQGAGVGVVGLGHVVLYVSDLDRSVQFYAGVLGWPVVARMTGFRAAAFRAGPTHHDLLLIEVGRDATPIPDGRRIGMYHFGVKVGDTDDQLRAMLQRLRAHPELATVVGAGDHGVTHSVYVRDPDGNEVELYVDVPGVDWNDPGVLMGPTRPLHL